MVFLGTFGLLSRLVAENRDDKDGARSALFHGTRLDGTFTIGLLLTYVFQVELSPYGRPIGYFPETATSTYIYVLGLIAIVLQASSGLLASLAFPVGLLVDGFVGTPKQVYDLSRLPVEGDNPEEYSPLRLKAPPPLHPNEDDKAKMADKGSMGDRKGTWLKVLKNQPLRRLWNRPLELEETMARRTTCCQSRKLR